MWLADFVAGFVDGWRNGPPPVVYPGTLDDHILATISMAERTAARMDEIVDELVEAMPWGFCCPGCASAEWRQLSRKQERRLPWLVIMLRKSGSSDYSLLASDIERGVWP